MVRRQLDDEAERQALMAFITLRDENSFGQRALTAIDYAATGLFAAIGVIVAGQAGMNLIGATFVGAVACVGGGTLNNLITNNTHGGVFWVRDTNFLAIALGVSIFTFYAWPHFEEWLAAHEMDALKCAAGVAPDATRISYGAFAAALASDPALHRRMIAAVGGHVERATGQACSTRDVDGSTRHLFEWLLAENPSLSGHLEMPALQQVARIQAMNSQALYVMESLALGGVSVIGAQAGITRGLPPLACIVTGVTICFGGILRDVLCQRPVAIGSQSYALATAAGASVYVALRELVVAGWSIPLLLRLGIGGSTAIAQRWYSWLNTGTDDQFLKPMAIHGGR